MKKIILLFFISSFLINIKSNNKEDELKELFKVLVIVNKQINRHKIEMDSIYFIRRKKELLLEIQEIINVLPEGRGEELIEELENESKLKK